VNEYDPMIGNWYKNRETDTDFEIVAMDERARTLEIQYADGQLAELDMETWSDMVVEAIEPPEDYSGPLEALNPEDLGYNSDDTGVEGTTRNPGNNIDRVLRPRSEDEF
jgi:hypothetical protein